MEVRLLIKEIRTRAVIYVFQFRRIEAGQVLPAVMAQGEIAAVCVTADAAGQMMAQPIPAEVRAKLEVAPAPAFL